MADYDVFEYVLPGESAEVYATNALRILKDLKAEFPDTFRNFAAPSEVLTLSGARAFDTYYELGPDKDEAYKQRLRELLMKHDVLFIDETLPVLGEKNEDNCYSIVHLDALKTIPQTYQNLPFWQSFDHTQMRQDSDFFLWWMAWRDGMYTRSDNWQNGLLNSWLAGYLPVAHDMTFGVLLGYPGEAIVGAIVDQTDGSHKTTDAKIHHADKYDGAQPVYNFPAELAENPTIVAHQKLWSDILDAVYRDPMFADED